MLKIGFLSPGEMGISLAASAQTSTQKVFWCSQGRSPTTHARAEKYQLEDIPILNDFCQHCDIIISVCPPHSAFDQAQDVIKTGFKGLYADVNAISPETVKAIAAEFSNTGIDFVDGGIIGLPAWQANSTWLYLCGTRASELAQCFEQGFLETTVIEGEIGKASALKMCFAANSKGVSALLTAILATAEQHGVRDVLEKQWDIYNPGFTEQSQERIQRSARKAWRFVGEMEEIASTLKAAGLPDSFHLGAADIYQRQEKFKDSNETPTIESILKQVTNSEKR